MYVMFLRGINVSGKNKVDMKLLKELLSKDMNISTYLATGNIIIDEDKDVSELVHQCLKDNFSVDVPSLIRTKTELETLINMYPYDYEKNCYITLFDQIIEDDTCIQDKKDPQDLFQLSGANLFLYTPNGYGKTKLTNNYLQKCYKTIATTRNINTIKKVYNKM